MAGDPARKRATYADVLATPASKVAEVLDGVLYTHARPASKHARAASRLGAELGGPFDRGRNGPGGWIILDEPELHLGPAPDIVVPDLAAWRRERMPELPDAAFFTLSPDWVCEIASPPTASIDRTQKLPIYARERVRHVWILDPDTRELEILMLEGASWRSAGKHRDSAVVHAEPFHALALELAALWET